MVLLLPAQDSHCDCGSDGDHEEEEVIRNIGSLFELCIDDRSYLPGSCCRRIAVIVYSIARNFCHPRIDVWLGVAAITSGNVAERASWIALAALGLINFLTPWIELGITLSLFVLAVELADRREPEAEKSWLSRFPWAMAIAFGLLHGLGFASALGEIGLPRADIPAALFSFNVGIELGQISWVLLVWILWASFRRLSLPSFPKLRTVATYAMGTCATYPVSSCRISCTRWATSSQL